MKKSKPNVKPRLFTVYLQQVIQLLILLIHLGILGVFIGGSRVVAMDIEREVQKKFSLSSEWAGLVGVDYGMILHYPWVILVPLLAFTTVIAALKLILAGLRSSS
ncbi:hypothetical protein LCM20_07755 [Halobacillus litoralis]|uniref:hypothetical protein n=1 Tax=Halobacillus litoralis TaxID=45668 RepID=UPI001CD6F596|nr:hypothetical protein [Halobacillus litoralis]MCA0970476.1 hypothetical protein [Halobacillus litoralis]